MRIGLAVKNYHFQIVRYAFPAMIFIRADMGNTGPVITQNFP